MKLMSLCMFMVKRDLKSEKFSTCQSNDNTGSIRTSSEHSVDLESEISRVPQEVPNVNFVRPNVNTVRTNINSPVPTSNSPNFSSGRPQVNKFNQRSNFSKSHSSVRRPFAKQNTAQMYHSHAVKGNWGFDVKTSACYNWRNSRPNSNCDSGPTFRTMIIKDHPLKNMVDRGIFDSGCSGHMTDNKDQLEDFEEFNGGSVTFGGSKGYITKNLQQVVVNFLDKDLSHGNARNRPYWLLLQLKLNMLLQIAVDKYCGFKINCWTMVLI
ncbi:hypothetical protein Tco_1486780 [Tanacetum coccineum]